MEWKDFFGKNALNRQERPMLFLLLLAIVVFSLETNSLAYNYVAVSFAFLVPVFGWVLFTRPSSRKMELFLATGFCIALPLATMLHKNIVTLGVSLKELVGFGAGAMLVFELAFIILSFSFWEAEKKNKESQQKIVTTFPTEQVGGLA